MDPLASISGIRSNVKPRPQSRDDWKALAKRQAVVILLGAASLIITGLTNKLMASNLMKVEQEAEAAGAQAMSWQSFDSIVQYYEARIEALEAECRGE